MKIENIKRAENICREIENTKRWKAELTNAIRIKSITYETKSGRDINFSVSDHQGLFQIWTKLLVAGFEMDIDRLHRKYYWLDKEESTTNTKEE